MWAIVLGTGAFVAVALPSIFFVTALLAAAALVLRALAPTFAGAQKTAPPDEAPEQPYRVSSAWPFEPAASPSTWTAPIVGPEERARSFAGALFAVYLSAWTLRWSGGPLPAHVIALDAALTVAVILAVWKLRVRWPIVPLVAAYAHLVVKAHLVPPPRSPVEWGATAIALGFVLLGASLATSYRFRGGPPVAPERGPRATVDT